MQKWGVAFLISVLVFAAVMGWAIWAQFKWMDEQKAAKHAKDKSDTTSKLQPEPAGQTPNPNRNSKVQYGVRRYADPAGEHALVTAEVADVQQADGNNTVTCRITRVHKGPASLLGREFGVSSAGGAARGSAISNPPLRKGEVLICALKLEGDSLAMQDRSVFLALWPVRKGVSSDYDELEELALAIEGAEALSAPQREDYWKKQVFESRGRAGTYAVREVARLGGARSRDFLKEAAVDPRAGVGALFMLDEVLFDINSGEWVGTPERFSLLKRWMSEATESYEGAKDCSYAENFFLQGQLDGEQLRELAGLLVRNEKLPAKTRVEACHMALLPGKHSLDDKDIDAALDFCLDVIGTNEDRQVRIGAATAVAESILMTPARAETIRKACDEITDAELKAELEKALQPGTVSDN